MKGMKNVKGREMKGMKRATLTAVRAPGFVVAGAIVALAASTAARQPVTANWPSFRGQDASGIADGQQLPTAWNGQTGANVRWKVAIDGPGPLESHRLG